MERLIGILFALSCIFLNFSCIDKNESKKNDRSLSAYSAEITLLDSVYDFGKLHIRREPYSYSFKFKNTGEVPAVILHAKPSCRCTSATYNKAPIGVGKNDSVTVFFDTMKSEKGYFNKVVKISINSSKSYSLTVKGFVE